MTDRPGLAHSAVEMLATDRRDDRDEPPPPLRRDDADVDADVDPKGALGSEALETLYEAHFSFVWRMARRFGVPDAALDDAVQDVFLVVHARLADFEGRSSVRTWLLGITRRVARAHRPRRDREAVSLAAAAELAAPLERAPDAQLEQAQSNRVLHALLDTLDDDKREAFVLAELEELSMPEVAEALSINVNTAASRVRAARKELEQALARAKARQRWRLPWAR